MASKRRNMFHKNKTQETTEEGRMAEDKDIESAMLQLKQYARAEDKYGRRMVGRTALEVLRLVSSNPANAASVLDIASSVVDDEDTTVRCELMENIPHLALMLSEDNSNEALKSLIISHLMPIVIKVLADPEDELLHIAESALMTMLEHCLVSCEYIAKTVWPVIRGRIYPGVKSTVGVLTVMNKMTPWVGSDVTEQHFVPLLVQLSANNDFIVRRACASVYSSICTVVGTDVTENILLSSFLKLCSDSEWGVRQTCAEVFMSVSCACRLETRKRRLAPVFASLLCDTKRWVQLAAFQALGPFITTFAEPSITVLGYNPQGELVLKHPHGFEFKLRSSILEGISPLCFGLMVEDKSERRSSCFDDDEDEDNSIYAASTSTTTASTAPSNTSSSNHSGIIWDMTSAQVRPENEVKESRLNGGDSPEDENSYNQFNFWREPIFNVDLNGDIVPSDGSSSPSSDPQSYINPLVMVLHDLGLWKDPQVKQNKNKNGEGNGSNRVSSHMGMTKGDNKKQDIVPEELINHFVSMPVQMHNMSDNMAHHCAYNLPAVALTLGPENWTLLKGAYETLAADRQWKVRRIVASSIHELAVIVGEDVATQDLVPVFTGFIKDLDEVRIGALKHLAHFLKLLRPAGRNSFLPRLAEFLMTDYDWNWRFRKELAEQLLQALGLFTPADTCHHLTPVAMTLLLDKVANVRKVALHLVTKLVNHLSIDETLLRGLLAELAEQFAHNSRWNRRQTFALLCARLVAERVLSDELFAKDILPHLLDLSWDRVPNVRLAVARTLATELMAHSYYSDSASQGHESLMPVLKRLQNDRDRDVRYFATLPPRETTCVIQQKESVNERRDQLKGT